MTSNLCPLVGRRGLSPLTLTGSVQCSEAVLPSQGLSLDITGPLEEVTCPRDSGSHVPLPGPNLCFRANEPHGLYQPQNLS